MKAYGFQASPALSARHNASIRLAMMPYCDYLNRPTNKAFHDLTSILSPPPNLKSLLGLVLKYIPTPYRTTTYNMINEEGAGLPALERSLWLRSFFCATGGSVPDPEYNPKLHVPSLWDVPDGFFPKMLEDNLHRFRIQLYQLFKKRRVSPNLSRPQQQALTFL